MDNAIPTAVPPVTAVIPVKPLTAAKSRLALPPDRRRGFMLAFALDTLVALTTCDAVARVIVVTADPDVAAAATRHGALVVADPDTTDLNDAITVGVGAALRQHPNDGVLVVPADLPCLRPTNVTDVLRQARRFPAAFVPDRAGSGTTLVVGQPGQPVLTRYGRNSAARHTDVGLEALTAAPARARHDVDTREDLRLAITLGVGDRTAALAREVDW
jgi:2-phospho-L-lactate guanylyltransferase